MIRTYTAWRPVGIFSFLLLTIAQTLPGQHLVRGQVLDADNQPLERVRIDVRETSANAFSDQKGRFEIFAPQGQTLIFKKTGYRKKTLLVGNPRPEIIRLMRKGPADKLAGKASFILRGGVRHYRDGRPLAGAIIGWKHKDKRITTDKEGRFQLEATFGDTLEIQYEASSEALAIMSSRPLDYLFSRPSAALPQAPCVKEITKEDFHTGNIHHPLQLIQGKLPGVIIASGSGNNPFGEYSVQIRGLSTLNGNRSFYLTRTTNQPLYLVDGLPTDDLTSIDPMNVSSVGVVKGGTAARYGIRGARGVIQISTRPADDQRPGLQYHSYLGVDQPRFTLPFMDADQYRSYASSHPDQANGGDFGASTNWLDRVSRTAVSQAHHLSLSQRSNNTIYQLSLIYRDANGILKDQGFDRLQGQAYLRHRALNERLSVDLQLRTSTQNDNYSQPLAFRYAQSANPTQPIYDQQGEFGGYFQRIVFEDYNPVALLEQNISIGHRKHLLGNLEARLELLPALTLAGNYQVAHSSHQRSDYQSKYSLFGNGQWRNGFAEQAQYKVGNRWYDVQLDYRPKWGKIRSRLQLGHQYQLIDRTSFFVATGDFLTDAFSFHNLGLSSDIDNGLSQINTYQTRHKLSAFYGQFQLSYAEWLRLHGGWRMEGSSRLGDNRKWGHFPHLGVEINLAGFSSALLQKSRLQLHAEYGISGNPPFDNYLSLQQYQALGMFSFNNEFIPFYGISDYPNADLREERTKDFSLGLRGSWPVFGRPLSVQLDAFRSLAEDIIVAVPRPFQNYTVQIWSNEVSLKSRGLELQFSYPLLVKDGFDWQSELVLSAVRTVYDQLPPSWAPEGLRISPGSPGRDGCCKAPVTRLVEGEEAGAIWVPHYLGLDANGQFILADDNGDGYVDPWNDAVNAGSGLPDWTLGWNNQFHYGPFDLQLFFRGAFGHRVFNVTRKTAGNPTTFAGYNILADTPSSKFRTLTDFPQESDAYVEGASFLRLQNLTMGYTLPAKKSKSLQRVRLYLTAQNLFTLSGYSGWDPDIRLDAGGYLPAAGYEFRTSYLPTRSFVLGIRLLLK